MNLPYTHESIRLTGRWDKAKDCATATATGSYIEFAFEGRMAVAQFNIDMNFYPLLHLWIQVDNGVMVEAPIENYLRVIAPTDGAHICRIIYKGGTEVSRRWYQPLHGKVTFLGVQTEKPLPLPADTRKTIEFVGDSITEGVLIDVDFPGKNKYPKFDDDQLNRIYQDDVCATYAWLTAEALDLRPIFMGYGAVGVTRAGCSNVPAAPLSYPYNFEGSPITHKPADFILINHGANDRGNPDLYLPKYGELLDVIRQRNPNATIISLSAFCGAFHEELGEFIRQYNEKNNTNVHYIDSFGWIPKEPLHPLRDGHKTVADHLIPLLKKIAEK